jgi:hypothetical protein
MKERLIEVLSHPRPLGGILRNAIKRFSLLSYKDRLRIGAVERPHYGYCIFEAAKLAKLLNYGNIGVVEFGCAGGNGLVNAEMHIAEVARIFDIEIELYGFDSGSGLVEPKDYRDIPYYFQSGLYHMDRRVLEQRLKKTRLVIGDVKDTCPTFFRDYAPAPIGCIFYDLDYYSSTKDALTLLDGGATHFLPRTFLYFDDIMGDALQCYNDYTGERLAIAEFNQTHRSKKIASNHYLPLKYPGSWWPHKIFVFHDFEHPKYNDFIGGDDQVKVEKELRLK